MRSVMMAAVAVSLPLAAAWDPPECHEYLAQQAKLEGAHEAVLKDWSGHSFNNSQYRARNSTIGVVGCGKKIFTILKANDLTFLNGDVTSEGGTVMAKSGNGTWAGEVKMYVGRPFTTFTSQIWSHTCATINGLQLHGKIGWDVSGLQLHGIDWRPNHNHSVTDDDDDDDILMDPDCVDWAAL